MRLSKDKDRIIYNDFLTLAGVPPKVFDYRIGNRSAVEWIIDQYQVSTDKRSGITNDPNLRNDPEQIVRLVGQVITISLETVELIRALPPCEEGGPTAAALAIAMAEAKEAEAEPALEALDEAEERGPPFKDSRKAAKTMKDHTTRQKSSNITGPVTEAAKASKRTRRGARRTTAR